MRGSNEDELGSFVELTKDRPVDVRFIEWMPFDSNRWDDVRFVPYREMVALLEAQAGGALLREDPAREAGDTTKWHRMPGHQGRIGFITLVKGMGTKG